ncbi:MAG: hypothetical protein JOZ39_09150 [Chloroflexi bacterium]|nr:hypothetical protein [Chloroflexota bacterium]
MGTAAGVNALLTQPQIRLPGQALWRRQLPAKGKLCVELGNHVDPDTIVAEALRTSPPVVIDIERAQVLVEAGQDVAAGAVIARRRRLLGRGEDIQAPVAGRVLQCAGDVLLLQPPPLSIRIEAQLPGCVAAIHEGAAIDIEGHFGLITPHQAVGPSCYGVLGEDIAVAPEPLSGGRLQAFVKQGVRAVVGPSLAGLDQDSFAPGITCICTEPFPGLAMAAPIATLLRDLKGARAAIQTGRQPVLALALPDGGNGTQSAFGPGAWVRLANGTTGRLTSIAQSPRFFESGLRAVPAEVELGDHTELAPIDSLEWIA